MSTLTSGGSGNGTGQNPYPFKAGIQDRATVLIKFGLRWYNPTTGTWTQQDTLDTPLDPANANRYAYAGDDPVNGIDSTGTRGNIGTNLAVGAGGGFVLGAAVGCAIGAAGGAAATAILGPGAVVGGLAGCFAVAQPLGFAGSFFGTIGAFVYTAIP